AGRPRPPSSHGLPGRGEDHGPDARIPPKGTERSRQGGQNELVSAHQRGHARRRGHYESFLRIGSRSLSTLRGSERNEKPGPTAGRTSVERGGDGSGS